MVVTQQHPAWCDRMHCTATGSHAGAHRSVPTAVDPGTLVKVNLYATAAEPDIAFVEIDCRQRIVPAATGYALGRLVISLSKQANGLRQRRS